MKTFRTLVSGVMITCLFVTLFYSCKKAQTEIIKEGESLEQFHKDSAFILRVNEDGSYKLLVSEGEVLRLFEQAIGSDVISQFSVEQGQSTGDFSEYYLLGKGEVDGNGIEAALYLKHKGETKAASYAYAAAGASCTGNPCSKCTLVGLVGDQGCECQGTAPCDQEPHCNHKIWR